MSPSSRFLCPWDSPGKDTGVDCHSFLQGIFLSRRSNPGLLHCRQILSCLSYREALQFNSVQSLSRVQLFATPWTVALQASLSVGFSRQAYWSRLSFPSPGNLPDPGIEPRSPALQTDSLPSEPPGKPWGQGRACLSQLRQELSSAPSPQDHVKVKSGMTRSPKLRLHSAYPCPLPAKAGRPW